jgi:hypothetical protein
LRGDGGGDGGITQVPNVEFVCKSEATTSACSCKKYNIMFLIKAAKNSNIIQKEVARNTADGSSPQVGENITTPMVP